MVGSPGTGSSFGASWIAGGVSTDGSLGLPGSFGIGGNSLGQGAGGGGGYYGGSASGSAGGSGGAVDFFAL